MPSPDVSYFAQTNHRNQRVPFGIRQLDRLSHMYIVGQTGVGKSTMLETLALQDMLAGRGFALVDPHGDLVERLAERIAAAAPERLVYLDACNSWQPYGYNPLRRVRAHKIPLAVSGMLETLKKLWPDAWGVRMEHVLRNSLYALLEREGSKLPDVLALYNDDDFRKEIAGRVRNEVVRRFWQDEFENYPVRLRAEACAPIQNKLGALLSDPTLHRILVQPTIDLHFRKIMDEGMILLVNVSKGRLGEESALLLGSLLVSTIGLAAFSRAETEPEERRPYFLYLDEFHNFTTLMLASMMSELRKYGLGLVLAHQYLNQLEPEIRHAVFGNAGTIISFRVGPEDATLLADEFQPKFDITDLLRLPNRSLYLKLMIDGAPSVPFSADAIAFDHLPR
ncbi:MAG: type IV secretion system DNA-binding domain-containing protein [Alphaproteobacteria bacterium]|nr:type IV secretion system DNA-binding domain-containing protein [Alphaproteobacteria bacterium]MBV9063604.1 type IV secretion system DNA-binding domain-containing protein [Alphaproteobacteria bacterium]